MNKEPTNMKVKKNKDILSFAEACDRVQVSDLAAALLSISLLEDYDMVTRKNSEKRIDKNKKGEHELLYAFHLKSPKMFQKILHYTLMDEDIQSTLVKREASISIREK